MNPRQYVRRDAGFSAVESVLVISLLAVGTLGLAHTIISGQQAIAHLEADSRLIDHAQVLMTRLNQIPFGAGNETAASGAALAMIVAPENTLFGSSTGGGTIGSASGLTQQGGGTVGYAPSPVQLFTGANVTLTQLRLASPLSWQYGSNGSSYLGPPGTWQIIVDRDLNGDGDLLDPMETQTATTQDLFRVEIRHAGRRILHTVRSRNPQE